MRPGKARVETPELAKVSSCRFETCNPEGFLVFNIDVGRFVDFEGSAMLLSSGEDPAFPPHLQTPEAPRNTIFDDKLKSDSGESDSDSILQQQ